MNTLQSHHHLRSADPVLARLMDRVELTARAFGVNHYQSLVESIVAQQLSDKAATTIIQRFKKLFPRTLFPKPEKVLSLPVDMLRSVGISGSKANYIRDLSEKIVRGEINLKKIAALDDEGVIAELTKVKGIGRWTAEMFLIFSLGRPDVFSYGDLGLKNALQRLYKLRKHPSPKKAEELTKAWRPHRSLGCRYLWASLALKEESLVAKKRKLV